MVRIARLTVALVVLAVWGCGALRTVPRPAAVASSPTRHILANGIPVIVQEHRGVITVASELHKGTTFTLLLPSAARQP